MTDGPRSPEGAAQTQGPEKSETKFPRSPLADKPEDISKLTNSELRDRTQKLHDALVENPDQLSPTDLRKEAESLREGVASGRYPKNEADPVRERLRAYAKNQEEKLGKGSSSGTPYRESFLRNTEPLVAGALGYGTAKLEDALDKAGGEAATAVKEAVKKGAKAGLNKAKEYVEQKRREAADKRRAKAQGSSSASSSVVTPPQAPEGTGSGGPGGGEPPSGPAAPASPENPDDGPIQEYKNFSAMNYGQLRLALQDAKLSEPTKGYIQEVMKKLEQQVKDFDQGDPFREFKLTFTNHIETNDWNQLQKGPESLDKKKDQWARDFAAHSGYNKKWDGVIQTAVEGAKAKLLLAGIDQRIENGKTPSGDVLDLQAWLLRHHFDENELASLRRNSDQKNIYTELLTDTPELQVGSNMRKPDVSYRTAGGVDGDESPDYPPNMDEILGKARARDNREYEAAAPIPPDYIVATFKQSKYRRYERGWTEVEFLDIRDKDQLKRWAFLNMRVFNDGTIPGVEKGWKNILDVWLGDLKDSMRRAGLEKNDDGTLKGLTPEQRTAIEETRKDLIAMMAASSSGRAMEQSDGGAAEYVATITQSQADRPDIAKQDTWKEFLLADDPGKYKRLIEMSLVKDFYKKVLEDAGIVVDGECGSKGPKVWDDFTGEREPTRKISEFHLVADADGKTPLAIKKKDGLVSFFSNKEGNGFEDYIKNLLSNETFMKSIGRDSTKAGDDDYAAARLACDAFLVEKFTRWEMALTDGYNPSSKSELRLNPFKGWGGDPFGMTEEPGKLPRRFKNKYQGQDAAVLVMFDNSFRPLDIFSGTRADERVRGTGVAHLKNFYRLNAAMWTGLGGSTAPNLPNWSPKTLQEELPDIADKIDQVYGSYTEPAKNKAGKYLGLRVDKDRNLLLDAQRNPIEVVIDDTKRDKENKIELPEGVIRKDNPIGKEIGGAICVRFAETKALALTLESRRPGFKDYVRVMFQGPTARPYYEIEKLIWGENLDGGSGFLASLAGARTRFILLNNRFGADANITSLWNLLTTNDQDPNGRGKMEVANRLGFLIDIAQAVASGGKPRK